MIRKFPLRLGVEALFQHIPHAALAFGGAPLQGSPAADSKGKAKEQPLLVVSKVL